jgi:hypothetical protein
VGHTILDMERPRDLVGRAFPEVQRPYA